MPAHYRPKAAPPRKPDPRSPVLVKLAPTRVLQIEGTGDIGSAPFREAATALYGLAYPVKFAARKRLKLTYKLAELEGDYWQAGGATAFNPAKRDSLSWHLMIPLPDEVSDEFVEETRAKVIEKKNIARLADVSVATLDSGKFVQALHVGAYADEPATVERMVAYAANGGYEITGHHHESYLGDPMRATVEKLKTMVRYRVRKKAQG